MSAFHVFYIPLMVALGVFIGFAFGKRSAIQEINAREKAERDREQRRLSRKGSDEGGAA